MVPSYNGISISQSQTYEKQNITINKPVLYFIINSMYFLKSHLQSFFAPFSINDHLLYIES